jgi:tetratricopeptide (TPR) repeat protein
MQVANDYEERSAALWAAIDDYEPGDFRTRVDELAATLPARSGVAPFERACAFDSTGHPDQAVPLYRRAIELGLEGERRRRAVIQMSSSLRNLGHPEQCVALLEAERERTSDDLDDAVACVLALGLAELGREREGLALVIAALAAHLPRYQRSMANYARALTSEEEDDD